MRRPAAWLTLRYASALYHVSPSRPACSILSRVAASKRGGYGTPTITTQRAASSLKSAPSAERPRMTARSMAPAGVAAAAR